MYKQNLDLLYGLVLGDGYISKQKNKNSKLDICHSPKQLEYLFWKERLLIDMGVKTKVSFKPGGKGNYPKYRLITNSNLMWTSMRAEMYSFRNTPDKERKTVTKNILDKCSIRSLLILFLDDGYNWTNRQGVHIATYCFTYNEQKLLKDWIFSLTNVEFTICRRKESFYLRTYNNAQAFKDCFTNFEIPDCMKYKLIHPTL